MNKIPYIGKWISCLYRTGQSFFDYHLDTYGLGAAMDIMLVLHTFFAKKALPKIQ